ncbi:MAG: glycoside hydrolase family 36 protein [Saprospiraceae bacterium]|nr:glycoside hydrolase family 36 protein [Saprospiraceae bacterium]
MLFRQAHLLVNGKSYSLKPNGVNSFAELYVDFQVQPASQGVRYTVYLHPKEDVRMDELELQFHHPASPDEGAFLANGYQSWSETRNLARNGRMATMRPLARPFMGLYGDEWMAGVPRGNGMLHSWTFAVVQMGRTTHLLGSLSEQTGFTLIIADGPNQLIRVRKELQGIRLSHSFPALDVWVAAGNAADLWAQYSKLALPDKPNPCPLRLGWTSWYRYFNRINERVLEAECRSVHASPYPFDFFQVDDGWQPAVGDWLTPGSGFSSGMGAFARRIRDNGMLPGLWLAPLVAAARSDLVKKHPEWLITSGGGKPLRVGWNPYWGGWYYALDPYHPGVRDYLSGVFHNIVARWGYDLIKLDFLFVAGLRPPPGKTRGQAVGEAMLFFRQLMGDKIMLACGVPLGSAMGVADICRIGGDVHLAWEHRLLHWLRFRERVSTVASLRSTLNRWALNKRFFLNDPDVFVLRKMQQQLSPAQQYTLIRVNALLGGILTTSDQVAAYGPDQHAQLREALVLQDSFIQQVEEVYPDVYRIGFILRNKDTGNIDLENGVREAWVNLTPRAVDERLPFVLAPFETKLVDRRS